MASAIAGRKDVRRFVGLSFVHDQVISDTDVPIVFGAGQFATARRARVAGQTLNRLDHAVVDIGGKAAQGFFRRAFQEDAIHGLLAAMRGEVIFQRTVLLRLGARPFEPSEIGGIFGAFEEFLVVLDWQNDGNEFAATGHDFRFKH